MTDAAVREPSSSTGKPRDELGLSAAALAVLAARYLRRDTEGRVVESTGEMIDRVAAHVAAAEDTYQRGTSDGWDAPFSEMMRAREFLPDTPTLLNAGGPLRVLAGCFLLPVADSVRSIFATLRTAPLLYQAGAGTGLALSAVRPKGDIVASSGRSAAGPMSFIRVYDTAAGVIHRGARRHATNMAVLDVSHPDIESFIVAKARPGMLATFKLSVGVTDAFLRSALERRQHELVNPRTGPVAGTVPARRLFDAIVEHAWGSDEPGLLFLDRVNDADPLPPRAASWLPALGVRGRCAPTSPATSASSTWRASSRGTGSNSSGWTPPCGSPCVSSMT